ncbi:MAG TPA: malonyl-ACP O-methyltransferase BioC [Gammaproteobacteria bacterium]|nr:malonyl-ACP O-methyltransferase BioC [Gammaproteobacteria bacterium]
MNLSQNAHKYTLALARHFNRAAHTYNQAAIIHQEVGMRLLDRLDLIKLDPNIILDLGSGTGFFTPSITKKYPKAHIVKLDIAENMLRLSNKDNPSQYTSICGDGEYLPLKDHSIDFVFSNCVFHWFVNPHKVLSEIRRVLKPEGLLLFSTFGPDTLKELRESFSTIDQKIHVNTFMDMHHIGDMLIQTQLLDPVMDMEMITLTYQNLMGLIQDLKDTGENYVNRQEPIGLIPKSTLDQLIKAYAHYRTGDGLLPATFEVIYGHAWCSGETFLHQADEEGVIHFPIADLQIL